MTALNPLCWWLQFNAGSIDRSQLTVPSLGGLVEWHQHNLGTTYLVYVNKSSPNCDDRMIDIMILQLSFTKLPAKCSKLKRTSCTLLDMHKIHLLSVTGCKGKPCCPLSQTENWDQTQKKPSLPTCKSCGLCCMHPIQHRWRGKSRRQWNISELLPIGPFGLHSPRPLPCASTYISNSGLMPKLGCDRLSSPKVGSMLARVWLGNSPSSTQGYATLSNWSTSQLPLLVSTLGQHQLQIWKLSRWLLYKNMYKGGSPSTLPYSGIG